jgi:hypothetical protein
MDPIGRMLEMISASSGKYENWTRSDPSHATGPNIVDEQATTRHRNIAAIKTFKSDLPGHKNSAPIP